MKWKAESFELVDENDGAGGFWNGLWLIYKNNNLHTSCENWFGNEFLDRKVTEEEKQSSWRESVDRSGNNANKATEELKELEL